MGWRRQRRRDRLSRLGEELYRGWGITGSRFRGDDGTRQHDAGVGQCIPPRAAIGHRHSTRPLRTPTYQS